MNLSLNSFNFTTTGDFFFPPPTSPGVFVCCQHKGKLQVVFAALPAMFYAGQTYLIASSFTEALSKMTDEDCHSLEEMDVHFYVTHLPRNPLPPRYSPWAARGFATVKEWYTAQLAKDEDPPSKNCFVLPSRGADGQQLPRSALISIQDWVDDEEIDGAWAYDHAGELVDNIVATGVGMESYIHHWYPQEDSHSLESMWEEESSHTMDDLEDSRDPFADQLQLETDKEEEDEDEEMN